MRWWLLIAVAACGRVGFTPIDTGNGNGNSDANGGSGSGSDTGSRVDAGAPQDVQLSACANAIPVQLETPLTTSTCVGGDHVDGCGPPNTQEVVLEFVAPMDGSYQFQAYDTGTKNVSNSTGMFDATCTQVLTCTGVLGISLGAGETLYFVVEASSGGCATVDFTVM